MIRTKQIQRIERVFDHLHDAHRLIAKLSRQELLFANAETVFARARALTRQRQPHQLCVQSMRLCLLRFAEHDEKMQIAVANVTD